MLNLMLVVKKFEASRQGQTLTKQHVSSQHDFRGGGRVELSEIFIKKPKFIAKETTQCHKTPKILETSVWNGNKLERYSTLQINNLQYDIISNYECHISSAQRLIYVYFVFTCFFFFLDDCWDVK